MKRFAALAWVASLSLGGCSDDGVGGTGGTDTEASSAGTTNNPTQASADGTEADTQQSASGEAGSSSNGSAGDLCGNGEIDPGEECDDGPMNSDQTPDACRTNCVRPYCYDGVTDPSNGEECDDGQLNGPEADRCRADCLLPACGDGIRDKAEACDDGNEEWGDTCFDCRNRYYFVLNAPADVSIIRATRTGEFVEIVGGDASYNGIGKLSLSADQLSLFALHTVSPAQVTAFDPVDGTVLAEVVLDSAALGYDADGRAMAVGSDGVLYVAAVGGGSNRLLAVDPVAGTASEVLDMGGGFEIVDMVGTDEPGLYITTGAGNSIMRADIGTPAMTTHATGIDNPLGITYDIMNTRLWTVSNPAGAPAQSIAIDLAGVVTPDAFAGALVAPQTTGLAYDVGDVLLATVPAENRIIAIQKFDVITDVFTDGLASPADIELVEMAP